MVRLSKTNARAIEASSDPTGMTVRQQFSKSSRKQRKKAVERWYLEGGSYFLEWVQENYRTHSGKPLAWDDPFFRDLVLINGCPWIERIVVRKGAQMGFTELMIALCAFALAEIRIPVGCCVDQKGKLEDLVPPRFQPSFDNTEAIAKLRRQAKATGRADRDSRQRNIQVGGETLTLAYAGIQKSKKGQQREVSSSLSSWTSWFNCADEIEGYPLGVLDILKERQSSCRMPTKQLRCGSTPGAEGGVVDQEIKSAAYNFDWWVTCPTCGYEQYLTPFGNLLKPKTFVENGISHTEYYDIMGAPFDWFHNSKKDAPVRERIKTAYIGCRNCGDELDWDTIASGEYADIQHSDWRNGVMKKGIAALELCGQLVSEKRPLKAGIIISMPRMASQLFSVSERLSDLHGSKNRMDCYQQGFGVIISLGGGKIDRSRLLECVGLAYPDWVSDRIDSPDMKIMGLDQGHSYNIAVVDHYWFPPDEILMAKEGPEITARHRWENAYKETVWHGFIPGGFESAIEKCNEMGVLLLGIDMEPEVQKAAEIGNFYPADGKDESTIKCFPMDQVELRSGEHFRKSARDIQGKKTPCFSIDRTFGYDAVRDRVHGLLHRLPETMTLDMRDDANFLHHLQTLERLVLEKRWSGGKPDHYMAALNFSEMTAFIHLHTPRHRMILLSI